MTSGGARPLRPLPRIRRFGSVGRTGRALLCAGALAGGGWAAQAGTVQVEVADAAGKPLADAVSRTGVWAGTLWSFPALALLWSAQAASGLIASMLAWMLALAYMARLLRRRLQGFTGDTLGATQQLCEVAVLLGLALTLT